MKKLFLMAMIAMFAVSASAQLLTSSRVARTGSSHNVWVDLGVGTYTGDVDDTGLGLDLGIRYNKMFHEYVGWDIVKIAAQADTKHFKESLGIKALTGIRGESPVLFNDAKAYANFAGGYYYGIDAEDGCFTWEIGAGLKLTPRFNVGIAYDAYSSDGATTGYFNLKLGYAF